MQYISHYPSPIGGILLAADNIGLTGLWFEGQKYFALYLDKEHEEKELPILKKQSNGWTFIFREKNRILRCRFTLQAQTSKMKYGKFCVLSLMGRR